MPLSYDIAESTQQVTIVGDREVTMGGMIVVVNQAAMDPRFRSHYSVLFDLRTADYTADLEDGEVLAAELKQKRREIQGRFAVVVSDGLFLLAKLYCVMARMSGFENIQCFNDVDQARAWCQSPASNSSSNCSR